MGDVVADPSGSWEPSTAEAYVDQQVATLNTGLASEAIARQNGDRNLQTNLTSEMNTRASQDANLNALINAGIREGGGVEFDIVPTQDSANGITSGGMYSTLRDPNIGFVDSEPTAGSDNLVKSGGVFNLGIDPDTNSAYIKGFDNITFRDGHINASTISSPGQHAVISVKPGDKVSIEINSNSVSVLCFVRSYDGQTLDFSSEAGYDARIVIQHITPENYVVPDDVKYVLVGIKNNNMDSLIPKYLKINDFDLMEGIVERIADIYDYQIKRETYDAEISNIKALTPRYGHIGATTITGNGKHILLSVNPNDSIEIRAKLGSLAIICFLKSYNGEVLDFSSETGYNARIVLSSGVSGSYTVPVDTKYIIIGIANDALVDVTPDTLMINGINYIHKNNINITYPFAISSIAYERDMELVLSAVKDLCVKSGRLIFGTYLEIRKNSDGSKIINIKRKNDDLIVASYNSSEDVVEGIYTLLTLNENNYSGLSFYILIKFSVLELDKTYMVDAISVNQSVNNTPFNLVHNGGSGVISNAGLYGFTYNKTNVAGQDYIRNVASTPVSGVNVKTGDVIVLTGHLNIASGNDVIVTIRKQDATSLLVKTVASGYFNFSVVIGSGTNYVYAQFQYNDGQSGVFTLSNCALYVNSQSNQFALSDSRFISEIVKSADNDDVRNNKNRLSYISKITKLTDEIQYPTADLNLVMLYGQSLAMASESTDIMTAENVGGNVFPGNGTLINPSLLGSGFTELTYNNAAGAYEPTVIHAVNRLKLEMDNKFMGLTSNRKMVACATGQGGQAIEQMMKSWPYGTISGTDYTGAPAQLNIYKKSFQKVLAFTKTQADAVGKTLACPVIMFMQGENNANHAWGNNQDGNPQTKSVTWNPLTDTWTEGADGGPTYNKDTYKSYLLKLKNDMQQDVMTILGQTKKPLWVMYVPGQWHTRDFDVPIQRAFVELMIENDDMIISAPTYPSPDYGSHLTSNGYRLLGEMFGKRICQAFLKGRKYYPLMAESVEIQGNTVVVNIPTIYNLVKDNKSVNVIPNDGFEVRVNGSLVTINSVVVYETFVRLTCAVPLNGQVEVAYANDINNASDLSIRGHGNIRNTDPYPSIYSWKTDSSVSSAGKTITYVPLDAEGASLEGSGKPYHCYEWLVPFYFKVEV